VGIFGCGVQAGQVAVSESHRWPRFYNAVNLMNAKWARRAFSIPANLPPGDEHCTLGAYWVAFSRLAAFAIPDDHKRG
jgi:hypothetical protein